MNGDPAPSHAVKVFSRGRWAVFTTYRMDQSSTPGICTAKEESLLSSRAVRAVSASQCGRRQSGPRYMHGKTAKKLLKSVQVEQA